jgi:hypothetical protein
LAFADGVFSQHNQAITLGRAHPDASMRELTKEFLNANLSLDVAEVMPGTRVWQFHPVQLPAAERAKALQRLHARWKNQRFDSSPETVTPLKPVTGKAKLS